MCYWCFIVAICIITHITLVCRLQHTHVTDNRLKTHVVSLLSLAQTDRNCQSPFQILDIHLHHNKRRPTIRSHIERSALLRRSARVQRLTAHRRRLRPIRLALSLHNLLPTAGTPYTLHRPNFAVRVPLPSRSTRPHRFRKQRDHTLVTAAARHVPAAARLPSAPVRIEVRMANRSRHALEADVRVDALHVGGVAVVQPSLRLVVPEQRQRSVQPNDAGQPAGAHMLATDAGHMGSQTVADQANLAGRQACVRAQGIDESGHRQASGEHALLGEEIVNGARTEAPVDNDEVERRLPMQRVGGSQFGAYFRVDIVVPAVDDEARLVRSIEAGLR